MIAHPIVDAHFHLWDLNHLDYPWLETVPVIQRNYLLDDYEAARGPQEVAAMVHVQAECRPEQRREETAWLQALADKDERLRGIVPFAPIETGDAVEAELAELARDPRTKGIRRIIQFVADTEPDFCLRPDFIRGVELLGKYGLHFEFTLAPVNFPHAIRLMEQCPETAFILDHVGNPPIAAGAWEPWASGIKAFAAAVPHPCKFSNFCCNADLEDWTVEDLKPYADHVIECFGPDRLIWGSDWPHLCRAAGYRQWLEAADQLTSHLSDEDRRKIFHDNAIRFYRLNR